MVKVSKNPPTIEIKQENGTCKGCNLYCYDDYWDVHSCIISLERDKQNDYCHPGPNCLGPGIFQLTRWIPVGERLPDFGKWVLVYSVSEGIILFGYLDEMEERWEIEGRTELTPTTVTHWMPFPNPPEVLNAVPES